MTTTSLDKCIACKFPKNPPNWHDYECPMCRCPQKFYPLTPKWWPMKKTEFVKEARWYGIILWFFYKFKWPKLREMYQENVWHIHNPISKVVQQYEK